MDATATSIPHGQNSIDCPASDYLAGLPLGLVNALIIEAEQGAHRVGVYLEAFIAELSVNYADEVRGLNWRTMFSAKTLLELAAALRLLEWEQKNLVGESMNLPDANQAIRQVLLNANKDNLQGQLSLRLVKVFAENVAWSSMRDLGAHVLLDAMGAPDDQSVDDIARLLLKMVREGRQHE